MAKVVRQNIQCVQNLNFLKEAKPVFQSGGFLYDILIGYWKFIIEVFNYKFGNKSIKAPEFDARVQEKMQEAKRRCFDFLGVDKAQVASVKPIFTSCYEVKKDENGATTSLIKYDNRDRSTRSSDYSATIYLFSDEEIFQYKYSFSMITGAIEEVGREYFYKDIQSVEVQHTLASLVYDTFIKKSKKKVATNELQIVVDKFALITSSQTIYTAYIDSPGVRSSISGLKQLIREKKRV